MFNLPININNLIMAYADDSIERAQKKGLKECLKTINKLPEGWFYTHILYLEENGSDWEVGEDGNDEEHIDFYIEDIINYHSMYWLGTNWNEANNFRMECFQNRINGGD